MEDYKEKYECALETIQEILSSGSESIMMSRLKLRLQSVFPELQESEDEKIRKALVEMVHDTTGDELWVDYNVHKEEALAWLEKQGEQKPSNVDYYQVDDEVGNLNDWVITTSHDEVEPKFKVGDWITNGKSSVLNITKFETDYGYELKSIDGEVFHFVSPDFVEANYYLWTIQDAKDGDVLVDSLSGDNQITILFKSIELDTSIRAYIGWNCYNFRVTADGTGYGTLSSTKYVPATKEQCESFFKKMNEAGYEWDAEKKELKKIEQKPVDSSISKEEILYQLVQNGTITAFDYLYLTQRCINTESTKDYHDIDPHFGIPVEDLMSKKKTAEWSDEDEANLNNIIWLCNNCINGSEATWIPSQAKKIKHLIETVKERGLSQQKPTEWSEEDEVELDNAVYACLNFYGKDSDTADWLKSLKDRIGG